MIEPAGREIRRRLAAMKPPKSQGWLALRLQVSPSYVSQVVRAEVPVSPRMAIKIASELGERPEFWRLQADYDVAKEQREMAEAEKKESLHVTAASAPPPRNQRSSDA